MKHYSEYMDRQTVPPALHEKLLAMEATKQVRHWQRYVAMAACFAVIAGLGAWRWTASLDPVQSDVEILEPRFLPRLAYPETNQGEMSADIALPDGAITVELTDAQIAAILGDPLASELERYAVTGRATYDGTGKLWQAELRGAADNGDSFYIELAPGEIPPTCVVFLGGEMTEVCGVEVQDWGRRFDSNGDGVQEHHYNSAFIAHDVGIRASFTSVDGCDDSTLFIYRAAETGLTLSHIAQLEEVPEFRSVWLTDYSQALNEPDFAAYLPQSVPEGFGEFGGKLVYQEGIDNHLVVWWHRGYDDLHLYIRRPEDGTSGAYSPVDINAPETWDRRLYSGDFWGEGLSSELLDTLYFPTFRAEDMTRDVIDGRKMPRDTGGDSYQFHILHPDGTAVEYSISGLTADEVWAIVEPTL